MDLGETEEVVTENEEVRQVDNEVFEQAISHENEFYIDRLKGWRNSRSSTVLPKRPSIWTGQPGIRVCKGCKGMETKGLAGGIETLRQELAGNVAI